MFIVSLVFFTFSVFNNIKFSVNAADSNPCPPGQVCVNGRCVDVDSPEAQGQE